MTQETDTTDTKLLTTTQMLRKWRLSQLSMPMLDLMRHTERIHLSMAFRAGQSKAWTFDEWYEETFSKEDK
jgi:hypothetical protein